MKKILLISGSSLVLFLAGIIGNQVNATSKVELEEIVMEQQMLVDGLKVQLQETKSRLTALENKQGNPEELDTRVSRIEDIIGQWDNENSITEVIGRQDENLVNRVFELEKIHQMDQESIHTYVDNIIEELDKQLWDNYGQAGGMCWVCDDSQQQIEVDTIFLNVGSFNYDIENYMTENEIRSAALEAYNQKKHKLIGKRIEIIINKPYQMPYEKISIVL